MPAYKGRQHSKIEANRTSRFQDTSEQSFFIFFLLFSHKHKNHFNSGMHTLIELKFVTSVGQPTVNVSTKFGAYRTKKTL